MKIFPRIDGLAGVKKCEEVRVPKGFIDTLFVRPKKKQLATPTNTLQHQNHYGSKAKNTQ